MEIRYEITPDDWVDAQMTQLKTRSIYWALMILGPLFILFGLLLLPKIRLGAWPMVALGVVYLLWPFAFFPIQARLDFKKHPQMMGPKLLRADDDGIRVESISSRSENKWSLYTRFRETRRTFMLHVGARNFMIIPKRAFSSAELDQFRALAQMKVSGK